MKQTLYNPRHSDVLRPPRHSKAAPPALGFLVWALVFLAGYARAAEPGCSVQSGPPPELLLYTVLLAQNARTTGSADEASVLRVASNEAYESTLTTTLLFDRGSLPEDARLLYAEVALTSDEQFPSQVLNAAQLLGACPQAQSQDAEDLCVLAGSIEPGSFAARKTDTTPGGLVEAVQNPSPGNSELSFRLVATGYQTSLAFYGMDAAASLPGRPRMVVRYNLPFTGSSSWPQPRFDAQHSGRIPWISNVFPRGALKPEKIYSKSGLQLHPILFDDIVYLVVESQGDDGPAGFYLYGVDRTGREVSKSQELGQPAAQPVATPGGLLLYANESSIRFLDLGAALAEVGTLDVAGIRQTPTVGRDGTFYVADGDGVTAYSSPTVGKIFSPPQVLWKLVQEATSIAPVALSRDQSMAFVSSLVPDKESTKIRLSAIDNRTGEFVGSFCSARADWSRPPTPVVGSNEVYIAADPIAPTSSTPAQLLAFAIPESGFYPLDCDWTPTLLESTDQSGGFTTPSVNSRGRPLAAHGASLTLYGEGQKPSVELPSAVSSNLVLDGNDNVLLFAERVLLAFDGELREQYHLDTSACDDPKCDGINSDLLLAPDGTLLVTNRSVLFRIRPDLTANNVPKNCTPELRLRRPSVFRASSCIRLPGNLDLIPSDAVILQSGGEVEAAPGFEVSKEAYSKIQTGLTSGRSCQAETVD